LISFGLGEYLSSGYTFCGRGKAIYRSNGSRMFTPLERRRFNRLIISLPLRYQTSYPKSGKLNRGHGVIRDISLTGSFFHLDHGALFQPRQILSLAISTSLPFLEIDHISLLRTQAEVVRIEPPLPSNPRYGVAVKFLQNLSFAPAESFCYLL
jgi:hypothetical protein